MAQEFIKDCWFCGQSHGKGKCQAYGLICAICLKRNHIARVCQSLAQLTPPQWPNKSSTQQTAKVRYVETEAVSSDKSIYALRSLSDRKHYHADVHLSTPGDCTKIVCKFQIDTEASCSTLAFANYYVSHKVEAVWQLHTSTFGLSNTPLWSERNKKKNHLPSCGQQLIIITFRTG